MYDWMGKSNVPLYGCVCGASEWDCGCRTICNRIIFTYKCVYVCVYARARNRRRHRSQSSSLLLLDMSSPRYLPMYSFNSLIADSLRVFAYVVRNFRNSKSRWYFFVWNNPRLNTFSAKAYVHVSACVCVHVLVHDFRLQRVHVQCYTWQCCFVRSDIARFAFLHIHSQTIHAHSTLRHRQTRIARAQSSHWTYSMRKTSFIYSCTMMCVCNSACTWLAATMTTSDSISLCPSHSPPPFLWMCVVVCVLPRICGEAIETIMFAKFGCIRTIVPHQTLRTYSCVGSIRLHHRFLKYVSVVDRIVRIFALLRLLFECISFFAMILNATMTRTKVLARQQHQQHEWILPIIMCKLRFVVFVVVGLFPIYSFLFVPVSRSKLSLFFHIFISFFFVFFFCIKFENPFSLECVNKPTSIRLYASTHAQRQNVMLKLAQ